MFSLKVFCFFLLRLIELELGLSFIPTFNLIPFPYWRTFVHILVHLTDEEKVAQSRDETSDIVQIRVLQPGTLLTGNMPPEATKLSPLEHS